MTKELTEKFMNNELDDRLYYFTQKISQDNVEIGHSFEFNMVRADDGEYLDCFLIHEVLAPVPSYEEDKKLKDQLADLSKKVERLQKSLAIATKALNDIRDVWANNPNEFSFIARIANRKAKTALEEMEGVK